METGLMFVQARYYMPEIGRFVEEDGNKGKIYNPSSLNWYAHCTNNPLKCVDLDGHDDVILRYVIDKWAATFPASGDKNVWYGYNTDIDIVSTANYQYGKVTVEKSVYVWDNVQQKWDERKSEKEQKQYFIPGTIVENRFVVDSKDLQKYVGLDNNILFFDSDDVFASEDEAVLSYKLLYGETPLIVQSNPYGEYNLICPNNQNSSDKKFYEDRIKDNNVVQGDSYIYYEITKDLVAQLSVEQTSPGTSYQQAYVL